MAAEKTFLENIEESLADEKADTEKYLAMAEEASQKYRLRGYDAILRGIAREESQHHHHLQAILADMRKCGYIEEKKE